VTDSNNATELFYTGSDGSDHSQSTHARVELDIDLAANHRIDICIDILADGAAGPEVEVSPVSAIPATPQTIWRLPKFSTLPRVRLHLREITVNAQLLFGFALGIYLITQLTQLPAFPIYFFCDEAVNTVLASDFIRDGSRIMTAFSSQHSLRMAGSIALELPYTCNQSPSCCSENQFGSRAVSSFCFHH
jgi:hypothetical protein